MAAFTRNRRPTSAEYADGKADLFYRSGGYWYVAKSTGTGFASSVSTGVTTASVAVFSPIDYDGDGLQDMVYFTGSTLDWRRNTGTSFSSAATIVSTPNTVIWRRNQLGPDVNGDGRSDLYVSGYQLLGCGPIPPYCFYTAATAMLEMSAGTQSTYWQVYDGGSPDPSGALIDLYRIDYNGDGLDDFMYPNGSNWYLVPNIGSTYDLANHIDTGISVSWTFLIADYDNDGRDDFLRADGNTWYVHRSTGSNLPSSPTTSFTSYGASAGGFVADITGDGLPDIVQTNGGNWSIHPHNGSLPDVVTTFENGLGHETDVTYRSLSHTIGGYYYTGTSSPTGPYVQEFSGPRYIVTDVSADDGIGGSHDFAYYYSSAFLDRSGRGWLSFHWRIARDVDAGTEAVNWYRQDFPYAGMTDLEALRRVSDAQHIRESDPAWDKTTNSTPTPDIHFIRAETTTSKDWEVGGTDDGHLIRTVVDNPAFNTTYGYVEERTVTTTDPSSYTWTTYTDYNPSANSTYWCLGLPGLLETTNTKPDSSYATRKLYHVWNSNCSLYYSIDQSDANSAKQLITYYTYDGYGNPDVVSTDSVDSSAQNRSVNYDYDSWGQYVTTETVGTVGLSTSRTWDYVNAQPASVTGTDGVTVSYGYDSFGRIASEDTPGIDTTYSYVAYTSWPSGNVYYRVAAGSDGSSHYEFLDALNRPIATQWQLRGGGWGDQLTEYNTLGQVARTSQPFVWGETIYWVDYTYDLIGRVIEEDAPVSESTPSGAITTTQYLGESVWVTDAENHTTKTEHNAVGQIVKVTDANSNYATYTYKPFGELATMTDAESNTTTIGYDARGFKSSMSDPNMGSWSYAYSLYGELASQTNALSQTTTLTYDEAGRLYQRAEAEGTTTWSYYAYNDSAGARGKLYSVSAPDSYSELYSYYTSGAYIGQPAWVRRTIDSADYYFYMAYDGLGRLSRLTYPTSSGGYLFKADYEYDAYGHLQYVKDGNETYTYYTLNATDALGRERSVTLGNGRTETRDYDDAAGYLKTIQTDGSVQNLTMTYDEVGNVLSRQDALISKTESFTYDPVNRLQTSAVGGSTVTMVYSAAGRITSKTGVGSYTYGSGGAGPFAVTNANGLNYTYDANGRMITRGSDDITWYSYDLPKKIENGTKTTEFLYGPDRARYQQELATSGTPDALITYVGQLYEFEDAATDTYRHYVQAGDRVVAVVERVSTTNTRQYLHRDHQGSVTKVTDASGNLLQALAFDAWGLRRDASDWSTLGSPFAGSHETERGYTGHEHLDTVGLIHMNGRVQDPVLGRFISADPLVQSPYSTQSHNRYSYVWNNPTSFTDPSGFTCTLADMSGCGGQDMNEIYAWLTDQIMYWQSGEGRAWADFLGVDAGHIAQQYFNGITAYAEAYMDANPIPTGRVTTVEMGVPNSGQQSEPTSTLPFCTNINCTFDRASPSEQDRLGRGARAVVGTVAVTMAGGYVVAALGPEMGAIALGAASGGDPAAVVGIGGTTRVGRWMSEAEFETMSNTGRVVEGAGGRTSVIRPPNPSSYTAAPPGSVYAEFNVPTSVLQQGGRPDWAFIPGPNINPRLFGPAPLETAPATCIVCVIGN